MQSVIEQLTGKKPQFSTGGGTSDARFIVPTGAQVIELGLVNNTIHTVNECTDIADLENLTEMYYRILKELLTR